MTRVNDNPKGNYRVYVYADSRTIDLHPEPINFLENEFRITPLQNGWSIDYEEYKKNSLLDGIKRMKEIYPSDDVFIVFYDIASTKGITKDTEYRVDKFKLEENTFSLKQS